MNPVSLAMDGLLAVLLVTAVAIGLRLNAKLKLLRDGQGTFVKAVADLDAAAMRAEAGLSALRSATQEAHDQLLTRIETARGLSARLDRASEDAASASARVEEAVRGAESATRRAQTAGAEARQAAERPAPRPSPEPIRSAEPIPFPSLRGEPAEPALRAALLAAERIVAETHPAPARGYAPPAAHGAAMAATGESRLAGFIARRRGARG